MRCFFLLISFLLLAGRSSTQEGSQKVFLREVISIEGIRTNRLTGMGLIVGLKGTGDGTPAARVALSNFLSRVDLPVRQDQIASGNIALVHVSAELPIFPKDGQKVAVTVNSIGDASSLRGGWLLDTQLIDARGEVMATASGAVLVGGFDAKGKKASITSNHPTSATIPGGGILEPKVKAIQPNLLNKQQELVLITRRHSYTTHVAIAEVINKEILEKTGMGLARPGPNGVRIHLDPAYRDDSEITRLIAAIEKLRIAVESRSTIIISEKTNTVIIGKDVVIEPCIVKAGNLTIQIIEDEEVSQPLPGISMGQTEKVERTHIDVSMDKGKPQAFPGGGSLKDLLLALQSLGIAGPEMVNVIRAMDQAGKIHAEIQIR